MRTTKRAKVLNLHQPFATMIAISAKRVETRSWRTNYRGPVLIHANATTRFLEETLAEGTLAQSIMIEQEYLVRNTFDPMQVFTNPDKPIPTGSIIAVAHITDCAMMGTRFRMDRRYSPQEAALGHWSPERYMWSIERVVALPEPIAYKSTQGMPWVDWDQFSDEGLQTILEAIDRADSVDRTLGFFAKR